MNHPTRPQKEVVENPKEEKDDDDDNTKPNAGTLILGATCCSHPTDTELLNESPHPNRENH